MRTLTRLPSQTGFSFDTAAVLASAAEDAYRNDTLDVAAEWGCNARLVRASGDECLVLWDAKTVVFAFRGTEFSWSEWLSNFTASPDTTLLSQGSRYHKGFTRAATYLWCELLSFITCCLPKLSQMNIYVCGHSRGGAILTALVGLMGLPEKQIKGIYTFGSPRCVGFHDASDLNLRFCGRWFRLVHSNDIVPHAPLFIRWAKCPLFPTWRFFHHVGIPVLLSEDGSPTFNASAGDMIKETVLGFRFDAGRDHMVHNYRSKLDAITKQN